MKTTLSHLQGTSDLRKKYRIALMHALRWSLNPKSFLTHKIGIKTDFLNVDTCSLHKIKLSSTKYRFNENACNINLAHNKPIALSEVHIYARINTQTA